jgi:hypothetical protein
LSPATPQIQRRYTRSDPRGDFPAVTSVTELPLNRLAVFWRPLIDMTDTPFAPMRLRIIRHVASWLAEPDAGHRSWFAMIGVAGLRHQLLRHAGLPEYDCADPTMLPQHLRTPQWDQLACAVDEFGRLDDRTRALVVFQLAQLSYCRFASDLAGPVRPDGTDARDRYAYEVARITARVPGRAPLALDVFEEVAATAKDLRLALAACAQGIGHSIRSDAGVDRANTFERRAVEVSASGLDDDWHSHLVRSRHHRAVALLRLAQKRPEEMREEIDGAVRHSDFLYAAGPQGADRIVADENRRIIFESQIKAAARARGEESNVLVRQFCDQLYDLDPTCVEARLVLGDGYAAIGDWREAARWYARAGELGTGAGAVGWFRAAQCHDIAGDRAEALNAMAHCLELDNTAVEPRTYLDTHAPGLRRPATAP